ncbi:MAG: nucleotidyl transferase AbiEii/AbiGii toxin family protein [Cyclobacteriaceae bacterium]|nr:nucleotidyl transferase AbiEii/AbiGii toxin family protein [Cyclobacteriaceae bacterium]
MLSVDELLPYYDKSLHGYREFILREYLQCKILQIIFNSPEQAKKLCFLGGTCLRIVHGNSRFSEDINFDNLGLTDLEFENLSEIIQKELSREGYDVEMKTVMRGAFHCYIRFPGLLFQESLSGHHEQKILIQLDTEPQHFTFVPQPFILNKFDVFTEIPVTPMDILLAQKFFAVINRKRSKGRDFFDIVFLLSRNIKPNYDYLDLKLGITNSAALKNRVLETCAKIDMKAMAKDVSPFLFYPRDANKIELFESYMHQVEL